MGYNWNPFLFNWNPRSLEDAMQQILHPPQAIEKFDQLGKEDAEKLSRVVGKPVIGLDFGCGIGRVLKYLPDGWIGYEPKEGMRKYAYIWLKDTNKIIVESLETFSQYFDVVYESLVFQHIGGQEWHQTKELIKKVLKPEGLLISRQGICIPSFFQKIEEKEGLHIYRIKS